MSKSMSPLEKYLHLDAYAASGTTKTKFRALRNFLLRPGVDVVAGEVLELTDEEASLLVSLGGTVEPVNEADRCRVVVQAPGVTWELPADDVRTRAAVLPWVGRLH